MYIERERDAHIHTYIYVYIYIYIYTRITYIYIYIYIYIYPSGYTWRGPAAAGACSGRPAPPRISVLMLFYSNNSSTISINYVYCYY